MDAVEQWRKSEPNDDLLSPYMDSHYPAGTTDLAEFWQKAIELISNDQYNRAIDLGCSVGRYTFELARSSKIAVGIDLNFHALASATKVQRELSADYKRRKRGSSPK